MKFKHSTKHVVANCRQTGTGQSVLCCYVASRPTNLFPNYFSHCFAQRTGPAVQISSQKTIGLQIRPMWTQWTIRYGVQCWRLTASLKQSWKQAPNSMNFAILAGKWQKNAPFHIKSPVKNFHGRAKEGAIAPCPPKYATVKHTIIVWSPTSTTTVLQRGLPPKYNRCLFSLALSQFRPFTQKKSGK